MQFCKKHWQDLRDAVKEKGMYHLVAPDGEKLLNRLVAEGENKVAIPDPLWEAHNMLLERAIAFLGLYILGSRSAETDAELLPDADLHYCPLCEARQHLAPPPGNSVAV